MNASRFEGVKPLLELLSRADLATEDLPQGALRWLLEDPIYVLGGRPPPARDWIRQSLAWADAGCTSSARHTFAELNRRLSFGRQCTYRIHRFVLQGDEVAEMNQSFRRFLASVELADGIVASNVGGYHSKRDLLASTESARFRCFLEECIAAVEAADEPFRDTDGAAASSELRAPTEAWINASRSGHLNLLHHHSDSTWSGAYYVADGRGDVVGYLGGRLLFRLLPGGGNGGCEPDEEVHVPRMALRGIGEEGEAAEGGAAAAFADVEPLPGSLVIFPGWLSHAVAPHFGTSERISVSFNVSLTNTEKAPGNGAQGAAT